MINEVCMKLIGISAKMGCGKTHLTNHLIDMLGGKEAWRRISLGDALKKEVSTIFNVALNHLYTQEGKLLLTSIRHPDTSKEMVVRELLQWWGTDIRRAQDINYWVNKTRFDIGKALNAGINVIVDDLRFPSELKLIQDLGGKTIRIASYPGYDPDPEAAAHASEIALDNVTVWDIFLTPEYGFLKEAANKAFYELQKEVPVENS